MQDSAPAGDQVQCRSTSVGADIRSPALTRLGIVVRPCAPQHVYLSQTCLHTLFPPFPPVSHFLRLGTKNTNLPTSVTSDVADGEATRFLPRLPFFPLTKVFFSGGGGVHHFCLFGFALSESARLSVLPIADSTRPQMGWLSSVWFFCFISHLPKSPSIGRRLAFQSCSCVPFSVG